MVVVQYCLGIVRNGPRNHDITCERWHWISETSKWIFEKITGSGMLACLEVIQQLEYLNLHSKIEREGFSWEVLKKGEL